MPKFEIADCHIALGGDTLNTVPRSGVTAAEIAVLQAIHGGDAVHDIKPKGSIERSQRAERERLKAIYNGAKDNDGKAHVENLYPGAAARVFEKLEELTLVDEQFAPIGRAARGKSAEQAEAMADADEGAELALNGEAVEVEAEDDEIGLAADDESKSAFE